MRSFILIAVLLFGAPALADITLEGPTAPIEVGEDADIWVRNLDYRELPNSRVTHWPREKVTLRPSLSWGLEPYIGFRARQPGRYLVAVSAAVDGGLEYAEIVVVVEGEGDNDEDDEDDGDDDEDPDPPGTFAVAVIYETTNLTGTQPAVLAGLNKHLFTTNLWWKFADQDVTGGKTSSQPQWLKASRKLIAEKSLTLPVIVLGRVESGVFSAVDGKPLPVTTDAAIELVEDEE